MSKNLELLQQHMQKKLERVAVIEQQVSAPIVHTKADGHTRIVRLDLNRATSEDYREFTDSLFLLRGKESPHLVTFGGIDLGESCSQVIAQLAERLAHSVSRKVCLVDAYYHSPSLSESLGFGNPRGLTDAARLGRSILSFTLPVRKGNLSLLPWGSFGTGSANWLGLDAMKTWLDALRLEFEYVLVNAPPLDHFADGIALGQLADGLVPVLDKNLTQPDVMLKVMEKLRESRVRVLGAVLTQGPSANLKSHASSGDGKVPRP